MLGSYYKGVLMTVGFKEKSWFMYVHMYVFIPVHHPEFLLVIDSHVNLSKKEIIF